MSNMIQCISPIDGSVYAERPTLTEAQAFAVVARARDAQKSWAARPLAVRVALVQAGVDRLIAMNDEVVPELAHMMGRPVRYGGETSGVIARTKYMADIAEDTLKPLMVEDSATFKRYITREPHGVILVVAPWNYPYLTAINTVSPGLMAGNSVIIKHASQTLLVGERMVRAFTEAGVPADVFQNVFLDHETTAKLIAQRCFGFVNFTGSVAGGKAMEMAAAGTFTPLGLELGGNDPGYVMEDADLDAAVATLVDGAMYNSGQCCCGIQRIYVVEKHYDIFVEKAAALTSQYKLGNPLLQETTLGPVANTRFANEVRAVTEDSIRAGAKPLIDRKDFPQDDGGAYLMPQLLVNVNHQMRIMREESFGPVTGIMKVKDDAEAIHLMNDTPYGLTASLWTNDTARAEHIGAGLDTGTVMMNRCDYLDPALCWTGTKDTGRGGALSVYGYHNLTRPKSWHLKKVTK